MFKNHFSLSFTNFPVFLRVETYLMFKTTVISHSHAPWVCPAVSFIVVFSVEAKSPQYSMFVIYCYLLKDEVKTL